MALEYTPENLQALRKLKTNRDRQTGRKWNSSAQGVVNALQGPTFGFLDELAGAGSAVTGAVANLTPWGDDKSMGENYRSARDKVRGATAQFREERPGTALATSLMASAPVMVAGLGAKAPQAVNALSYPARAAMALKEGVKYGGIYGAGESEGETIPEVAADTVESAAMSAATNFGMHASGNAALGVKNKVSAVAGPKIASWVDKAKNPVVNALKGAAKHLKGRQAERKLWQTLQRNAPDNADPGQYALARRKTLGPEATLADAAREPGRQQLDTLASLPGKAKQKVQQVVQNRKVQRGGSLVASADEALQTSGLPYTKTIEQITEVQKAASKPLYDRLKGVLVTVDDELLEMINAAKPAWGNATTRASLERTSNSSLKGLEVGDKIDFLTLDTLKQALWDKRSVAVRKGAGGMGSSYQGLWADLRAKLYKISPREKGAPKSIYEMANDAYAGAAQLKDAIVKGRTAMNQDDIALSEMIKSYSGSELEAFRVGALQSLKDKVGRQSGQTSLLKVAQEPYTQNQLKIIFGSGYRKFLSKVLKASELKKLERVGEGSMTAQRLQGAGDLNVMPAVGAAVETAVNPTVGPVRAIADYARRMDMPEGTRNELARMLLSKGPNADAEIKAAQQIIRALQQRAQVAATAGGVGSAQVPQRLKDF